MRANLNSVEATAAALAAKRLNRRGLMKTITVAGGAVVFAGYGRSTRVTAQDKIKLTQWYHEYGEAGTKDAAARYAAEYTKTNPNVEVEMVWVAGDYSGAKLPTALLTDEGPDVYEGSPTVPMVRQNQCVPLDDILTPEILADFNPSVMADNTIDGKVYAIKMVVDTGVLYYRPSMLEEAGVTPPTTMDEAIAAAQELDSGRVKGLFVGNDGGIGALRDLAIWSAGTDYIDANNQVVLDQARAALAWQKIKELNDSGALLIGAPTDWWDPSAFTQGLTAMAWGGLWAMPAITDALADDFGVVPWPALDAQGTPATFLGGWSEMVNGKSQHIDAAKQFVKWLWIDQVELQTDWNLSYGFHVPPRLSVAAAAEPLKSGPPAEAVKILTDYARDLSPVFTPGMNTALNDALTNIVKNGAPADQEVATATQTLQEELTRLLG